MSKKKKKYDAPLHIDATFDMTEEEDHAMIEIFSVDGRALTPQIMLDAFADMLTARYGMTAEDWDFPDEGLDS